MEPIPIPNKAINLELGQPIFGFHRRIHRLVKALKRNVHARTITALLDG